MARRRGRAQPARQESAGDFGFKRDIAANPALPLHRAKARGTSTGLAPINTLSTRARRRGGLFGAGFRRGRKSRAQGFAQGKQYGVAPLDMRAVIGSEIGR